MVLANGAQVSGLRVVAIRDQMHVPIDRCARGDLEDHRPDGGALKGRLLKPWRATRARSGRDAYDLKSASEGGEYQSSNSNGECA